MRLAVEAASLDALMMIPDRHAERARRLGAIDLTTTSDPLLERVILAHRAWIGVEVGAPDASTCAALALQALEGDLLLREAGRRAAYHLCLRTLVMTDRAEEARQAIAAMLDEATARGSLRLRRGAAWYASNLALRSGHVAEAENHARMALELVDDDRNTFTGGAIMLLLYALAERGEFEEARELLCRHRFDGSLGPTRWEIGIRDARARLWLAEGDFERAHAEACRAGALREQQGRHNPSWTPWRSTAALALAHLGRREEAAAVADAEVALAERFGAPVPIAHALHARAVAEADDGARVALCERGLAVIEGVPAVLQRVRLRLELGSTLAYIGRRIESRGSAAPGAGRRRCRRRRAAGAARAPRARGDRAAPAPGGDRGRRGAHAAPAPGLRAGRRGQGQPRDRPGAVPEHQDGRGASRGGLSQARRQRPRGAGGRAGQLGTLGRKVQGRPPIVRAAPGPHSRSGWHCTHDLRSMLYPTVVEVARGGAPRRVGSRVRRGGASPSSPGAPAVPAGPSRAAWPVMAWPWPSTTAAIRVWRSRSSTPSAATAGWPRRSPGTSRTSARRPSSPPRSPTAWARSRCWCSMRAGSQPEAPARAGGVGGPRRCSSSASSRARSCSGARCFPAWPARRSGRIVQVDSEAADGPAPGRTAYATAKSAQSGLTRSWARELAPLGITVNAVAPGVVPFERHAREEIAHAVSFIASEAASFITGQRIVVDGRGPAD